MVEGTFAASSAERRTYLFAASLLPLLLFVVALVPRVLNLGVFATMDEVSFWFARSDRFLQAISTGNFAGTAITDHPGVTTMWLGAIGILLRELFLNHGWLHELTPQAFVAFFEVPPAIVNAAAVSVGYLLLRPMVPRQVALVGALLWALDPFVIAYSRVLHVDALSGTFMTLSVLAAARYWFFAPQLRLLVLSGAFGGLAILSKSPGLILGPVMLGIAGSAYWLQRGTPEQRPPIRALLVWGLALGITAVALWPALWANPFGAYEQIRIGYTAEGTQPHELGNYFLGREDAAPGWLFYPVSVALRLTPISMLGLLGLPLAWRGLPQTLAARRSFTALIGFALLFIVAMSLFAKKFNRYIVPAFPTLDLVAALGLVWLVTWALPALASRFSRGAAHRAIRSLAYGCLLLATVVNVAWWQPYYIAAFNQLLGGAPRGAWAFKTGWGEGMEQVAAWLNQQPDITGVLTVTTLKTGLQLYLRNGAQTSQPPPGPLPHKSGYVVVYVESAQGELPPPFDQFFGHVAPIETIRVHGVDYAWIYVAPPAVDHAVQATFGAQTRLYGVVKPAQPTIGATLNYQLVWNPSQPLPANTMLFAHLIGPGGQRYAQIDLPYLPGAWDSRRYNLTDLPISVPADAPAGEYQLLVGLYNAADGARLPLAAGSIAAPVLDGPHVLLVDTIDLQAR